MAVLTAAGTSNSGQYPAYVGDTVRFSDKPFPLARRLPDIGEVERAARDPKRRAKMVADKKAVLMKGKAQVRVVANHEGKALLVEVVVPRGQGVRGWVSLVAFEVAHGRAWEAAQPPTPMLPAAPRLDAPVVPNPP